MTHFAKHRGKLKNSGLRGVCDVVEIGGNLILYPFVLRVKLQALLPNSRNVNPLEFETCLSRDKGDRNGPIPRLSGRDRPAFRIDCNTWANALQSR
jgi:hypothetical protein